MVPMLILHVEEGLMNSVKWPISAGQCHLPAALTPPTPATAKSSAEVFDDVCALHGNARGGGRGYSL